jgi:hypothetical protein
MPYVLAVGSRVGCWLAVQWGKWVGRDCGEGEVPLTAALRQLEGVGFNGHCKSLAYSRGIAAAQAA